MITASGSRSRCCPAWPKPAPPGSGPAYRQQRRYTDAGFQDLVECREQLLSQTGLLLPRGPEQASFHDLSIQEFLAAQRVWDLDGDKLAEVFRRRAAVPEWHNTLSFLFGAQLTK